jgi:hypothetical protein
MKQREGIKPPTLKTGDYVRVKESIANEQPDGMAYLRHEIGNPPYVVLRDPEPSLGGLEVMLRSHDLKKHPVVANSTPTTELERFRGRVEPTQGVVRLLAAWLEKVPQPDPELLPGRPVVIDDEALGRGLIPVAEYEIIRAKIGIGPYKILRTSEAKSTRGGETVSRTHYAVITDINSTTGKTATTNVSYLRTMH